jgi:hypothetical protein
MRSESPVITKDTVEYEFVVALDQSEYRPIIALAMVFEDGNCATYTRYRFSEAERVAIAEGADLLLSQPHAGNLMPIGLQLAYPNSMPMEEM